VTLALPFKQLVSIGKRGATPDAQSVPCSIWPTRTRTTTSGTAYDHEAEIPLGYAGVVEDANVVIVDEAGREYVVVEAQVNEFLPHVALLIRSVGESLA